MMGGGRQGRMPDKRNDKVWRSQKVRNSLKTAKSPEWA